MTTEKFCFSYIRFSSEKQTGNTSITRQTQIARDVAARKGWTFRDDLRDDLKTEDKAVSAYKGHNLKTIQRIVEAVDSGKIPQGCVMILEAWDRLTRRDIDEAAPLIWQILGSGLEIYIAKTDRHLTKASLKDIGEVIMALLEWKASFEYSDKISQRVKAAIKIRSEKILNGEKIALSLLPSWIDQKTLGVVKEKAGIIQSIFKMYLQGKGAGAIARELNSKQTPTLRNSGTWSQSVIYRMLSNRQVLGEYVVNGQTVKGYLTQIVSDETFSLVASKLDDNKGKRPIRAGGNTTGNITNLFSGVAFCSCGSPIKVSNGKGGKYVTCYGHIKGLGCESPMSKYSNIETSFSSILRLKPELLVRDENGNGLNVEVQILKGRLTETQKQIANITEALSVAVTKALVIRQSELETQVEEITAQIRLEEAKTVATRNGGEKLQTIVGRLENLSTDNEFRATVKGWIRENVNRMTVDTVSKTFTVDLKTGNFLKMSFDGKLLECKSLVSLIQGTSSRFGPILAEMVSTN